MDVNVKDLNKFIAPDGLTVLDEVRVSPTEPAFRQNGYETNGDKKGFALSFDAANGEYVELDTPITLSGDFVLEFDINSKRNSNEQVLFGSSDSSVSNFGLLLFSNGRIYYRNVGLFISPNNAVPLTGRYLLKVEKIGTTVNFYVNNSITYTVNDTNSGSVLNRIGNGDFSGSNFGNSYFEGEIYSFKINSESYDLKRGLGVELISSNGTTAEIKTSAANPQQRVNFGMWLKGDDINGWNPYTV